MAFKTITITELAYNNIKQLKHRNESFSKLFIRLTKEKSPMDRLFGAIPMGDAGAGDLRRRVKKIRIDLSKDIEKRRRKLFK